MGLGSMVQGALGLQSMALQSIEQAVLVWEIYRAGESMGLGVLWGWGIYGAGMCGAGIYGAAIYGAGTFGLRVLWGWGFCGAGGSMGLGSMGQGALGLQSMALKCIGQAV